MQNSRKKLYLFSALLFLFVIYIIFTHILSFVDSSKDLYTELGGAITKRINHIFTSGTAKNYLNKDYLCFELNTQNNKIAPFSSLKLVNDKKEKIFCASVLECSFLNNNNINLRVDNSKISVGLCDDEKFAYSADAKGFKDRWNKSIYSAIFKIPDYVPNDLSYNSFISKASKENGLKAIFGFLLKYKSLNAAELLYNTSIDKFPIGDDCVIRVCAKKDYLYKQLSKQAKKYLHPYFEKLSNKKLAVDFLIKGGELCHVESSLLFDDCIQNITIDTSDKQISLSAYEYKLALPYTQKEKLRFTSDFRYDFNFLLSCNKKSIAEGKINCEKQKDICPNYLTYGKNIYKLTISDIKKLYDKLSL